VGRWLGGTSCAWPGAWSRQQAGEGVYRLDEGAVLDDCLHCLQAIGVLALLEEAHGAAIPREMRPVVQDCLALRTEDLVRD
jgi:hypothetical protein